MGWEEKKAGRKEGREEGGGELDGMAPKGKFTPPVLLLLLLLAWSWDVRPFPLIHDFRLEEYERARKWWHNRTRRRRRRRKGSKSDKKLIGTWRKGEWETGVT